MILDEFSEEDRLRLEALLPQELKPIILEDWRFVGRLEQLPPPGDYLIWLYRGGRGSGKTRAGAEFIQDRVRHGYRRIAIVAPTAADCRDVVVEGESGLISIASDRDRPVYEPTKRRLTWPNGAIATLYTAEEPERLRGPQHDCAWCDEVAAWQWPQATFDMLMFGLRLGKKPQCMISTTPKPISLIKDLVKRAKEGSGVVETRGSSYNNLNNLAPTYRSEVLSKYEGTSLGRQEIEGELLEEVEEALWNRLLLESCRVKKASFYQKIVVAVDPPIASDPDSAEAGIIVAGKRDDYCHILLDASMRGKPEAWAKVVTDLYEEYKADAIVAEKNQGGEMVASVMRAVSAKDNPNIKLVHAAKAKLARAEPVSALYERNKVGHCDVFSHLENEMCTFVPGKVDWSPNRMDALVWGVTELMLANKKRAGTLARRQRRAA